MNRVLMTSMLSSVALFISLSATAAQPTDDAPSITVHYAASDLATDEGLHRLYGRILRAAEDVCPTYIEGGLGPLESCRQQAIARAIQQIGNARLLALATHTKPVG